MRIHIRILNTRKYRGERIFMTGNMGKPTTKIRHPSARGIDFYNAFEKCQDFLRGHKSKETKKETDSHSCRRAIAQAKSFRRSGNNGSRLTGFDL